MVVAMFHLLSAWFHLVLNIGINEAPLEEGEEEDNHEQYYCLSTGTARQPFSFLIKNLQNGGQQAFLRATASPETHDPRLVEHLERTNRAQRCDQEGRGAQQWDSNLACNLPGTRSIDPRSLEKMVRNILQRCQIEQHKGRRSRPDVQRHDRWKHSGWIIQPGPPWNMHQREEIIKHSLRIVEPDEDQRDSNRGSQSREVERSAEDAATAHFLIHQQRQRKRQNGLEGDDPNSVKEDVL